MPLQKQLIEIPFAQGLDTKTNAKLVVPGKLLELENGVFTEGATIVKRNGYEMLSKNVLGGTPITGGTKLGKLDDELVLFDRGTLYSYSAGNGNWISKGGVIPLSAGNTSVIRNTYQQSIPDSFTLGGISVFVWADTRGGVRASVIDEATGVPIQADVSISATGAMPKVAGLGTHILVTYFEGSNYRMRLLSVGTPQTFEAAVTLAADAHATPADQHQDLIPSGFSTALLFAYNTNAASIKVGYLLESGVVGDPANGFPSPISIAGQAASRALALVLQVATGDVYVLYTNTTAVRRAARYADLTSKVAAGDIDAVTNSENITGTFSSSTNLVVFYEIAAALSYNRFVKIANVALDGTVTGVAVFKRSVGLGAKAFTHEPTGSYAVLMHTSVLQATYFVVRSDGFLVAKLLPGISGGLQIGALARINQDGDDYTFAITQKSRIVSESNVVFTLTGISEETLSFVDDVYNSEQLGKSLLITGGYLAEYDGQSVIESGFHLFPENVTAVGAGAGGSMSNGTYQAVAVYEWTDNKGQRHRSAPSAPVTTVLAGGGAAQQITYTIPTLRLTQKSAPRTNVTIEIYGTETVGQVFYKLTSVTAPLYNDPTVDTVSFIRTAADLSIISNEILYTQGGILDNIAPPSPILMATGKGRAFVVPGEDRTAVWFSKSTVYAEGTAFSDFFTIRVDESGGDITALGFMDDKLVIFQRDNIRFVAGEGPDDAGANSTLTEAILITTDVGCSAPDSVAVAPMGLMFQSPKGIYILGRNLVASYIGAPVEAFNAQTITSALLHEDYNQVRFLVAEGSTLVYNYFFDQWGTFKNHEGTGQVIHLGLYHYLKADGSVMQETPSVFQDSNVDISMKLTTAWLKFAGIQGFQRVYRAIFLGDFKSNHKLRVRVAYDYQPFTQEEHIFDPATALFSSVYGTGFYGEESPYGGSGDLVYQFEFRMERQKLEAIQFEIQDVGANIGQAYSLSAISLEVGMKGGTFRLRNDAKNIA